MAKFEVGQKVIVARKGTAWNMDGKMDKWLGRVMTIGYCDDNTCQMEEDQDENNGEGWWWSDTELEPAEYAVEVMKLGDKMVAKNLISGETAEVKCDEDFNRSTRLALEKLSEKELHIGDKVKVVDEGALYTTYVKWVAENVSDKEKIAMYAYNKDDIDTSKTYTVLAIAPHQNWSDIMLVYVEGPDEVWDRADCFLIGTYGVQKV